MQADPINVLTGEHYLDGNHAACEGALAAGCRFAAGYPITPSTEIVERVAARFPTLGGIFIQMEDEIAASIAIQGAVWAGKKAMTVTSGPGFSLMMEHVGLAAMTETPCVFFNVQRGGPSTGLPTLPGQADMMQARWGSHGDYEIIALSPQSPQECFNLAVDAFNLAEQWRVPVLMMMDECVGHMTERVTIPRAETIEVTERRWTKKKPEEYKPFEPEADLVPAMAKAGDGYHLYVTGLTHDERGYPIMDWKAQEKLVHRLVNKIRLATDKIIRFEEQDIDGADVVVVSYGITSRVARRGAEIARQNGVKVGMLRLVVVWPFPSNRILELAPKIQAFVVPEMNYGQMVLEVERAAKGKTEVVSVPHGGGEVHDPQVIANAIIRAAKRLS
jgi:2-oxoglutarate ferredoxin oxidoreductase subunit alpha